MKIYERNKDFLVMTRQQVRAFDSFAINTIGIAGAVLMENAGRSCAELIKQKLAGLKKPEVCIFCGTGNNGGDGYVIARHLLNTGWHVKTVVCGPTEKIKGEALGNLNILKQITSDITEITVDSGPLDSNIQSLAENSDLVVDAVFGTGLNGTLKQPFLNLVDTLNNLKKPIVAVDIPSGLDCDTGKPLGIAVKAEQTVTFVAVKKGFTCEPSAQYTGRIYIASIGIEPSGEILKKLRP